MWHQKTSPLTGFFFSFFSFVPLNSQLPYRWWRLNGLGISLRPRYTEVLTRAGVSNSIRTIADLIKSLHSSDSPSISQLRVNQFQVNQTNNNNAEAI